MYNETSTQDLQDAVLEACSEKERAGAGTMPARAGSWAQMHVGTVASGRRWRYMGCAAVAEVGEENTRSATKGKKKEKRVGIT